jgi:hypothetical protein
LHFDLLARQLFVQSVPLFFPFLERLLFALLDLGLACGFVSRTLPSQLSRLALRSKLSGLMGLAIHDQQDQDQRPHRAQQHGQEGERRNLQLVPASSHAAFPG